MATTITAIERRAQLVNCAEAYFTAIGKKDASQVPWHPDVAFRGPLAPGFPAALTGRDAVANWFAGLYPALGHVEVIAHHVNEELGSIATRADVYLTSGRALRVVDRFVIDAAGLIVEQENHYDPRPAFEAAAGCISQQERDLLIDLLTTSERRLVRSIVGVSAAQWKFVPAADAWSIAQCAEHLSLSEAKLLTLVRDQILATGPSPEKERDARARDGAVVSAMRDRSHRGKTFDFLEPSTTRPTPAEFIHAFLGQRERTIAYARDTSDALHHHFAPLGTLGDLDAYQWLLLMATHTERHVEQIEDVKRSAGYPTV